MPIRTAWQAVTSRPLRFLASSWPWRSLAYLLSGIAIGAATMTALVLLVTAGVLLLIALVGLVAFLAIALSGMVVARFERRRMSLVDMDPLPETHRRPDRPGLRAWLLTRLREQATWRELGYTVVSVLALWWLDLGVLVFALGVPAALVAGAFVGDGGSDPALQLILVALALAMLGVAAYPITAWAGARAALTRAILAPADIELGERLVEVSQSRARLVDAFEAERQRIERDLHDGAQQRLVSLTMALGLARLDLPPDSPAARNVIAAQEQAKRALAELRELIRGVHPQVLTDRGLAAAIGDLAARSAVPVDVDVDVPRLPAPVEVTAYFATAECLANVAKHAAATRAAVRGRILSGSLLLEIRDNGVGGADPAAGTGIAGLADRVAAVGGRLLLSSPSGGPTILRLELPCNQTVHFG